MMNIGGISGFFYSEYEHICGMEETETFFFSVIFDHSKDIIEKNEFVFQQFESLVSTNRFEEIEKILNNSALLDAHGSIIKTLVILSSNFELLKPRIEELNQFLINRFGH